MPLGSRASVGPHGEVLIAQQQRQRWGLDPGAELEIVEVAEGLLMRPFRTPLTKVYLEPTTSCNLNCQNCMRQSWDEPQGFMPIDTFLNLIAGLREVSTLRTVAFWGIGEPLLHPDIVEMVGQAGQLGVQTELITNGLLLDRGMSKGLVHAGLDRLVVSIDGTTPESQAKARSGADLSAVQQNLRYLQEIGWSKGRKCPDLGIEFVMTRRNVSELPRLRALATSMGATFIVLTNLLPYSNESKEDILYWLSAGELYAVPHTRWFPEILVPRVDARREYMEPLLGLLRHSGAVYWPASDGYKPYCRFVNEGAIAVAQDGEVSPCVALMHSHRCYVLGREKAVRRYSLGNVAREDVRDIWNRDEFRQFRERVRKFEFSPCVDCGGCYMSESNDEDCFGNTFPVCGDCLWAHGVIRCP